jgi:transketolase
LENPWCQLANQAIEAATESIGDLECAEGKEAHPSEKKKKNPPSHGKPIKKRKTSSIKKDCRWKARAVYYTKFNAWRFVTMHDEHNHPVYGQFSAHLAGHSRSQRSKDVVESTLKYAKQAKNTSNDIVAALERDYPGISITDQDVRNILKIDRELKAGPLTPTQQFIHHLSTTEGITYRIYREGNTADGQIARVF